MRAAACSQLRPGQKGDVKADPDVEAGEGKHCKEAAEDVTADPYDRACT
jgi:hypothetical protein